MSEEVFAKVKESRLREIAVVRSPFEHLRGVKCHLGIDEAGRGPVLGPMVYGGFVASTESDAELKNLKVDDSKVLTEEFRDKIFEKLQDECYLSNHKFGYSLRIISPAYISSSMLGRSKFSLNEISHEAAMDLIQDCLDAGVIVEKVFVDTV